MALMRCYLHFYVWTLASRIKEEKKARQELGLLVYSALLGMIQISHLQTV